MNIPTKKKKDKTLKKSSSHSKTGSHSRDKPPPPPGPRPTHLKRKEVQERVQSVGTFDLDDEEDVEAGYDRLSADNMPDEVKEGNLASRLMGRAKKKLNKLRVSRFDSWGKDDLIWLLVTNGIELRGEANLSTVTLIDLADKTFPEYMLMPEKPPKFTLFELMRIQWAVRKIQDAWIQKMSARRMHDHVPGKPRLLSLYFHHYFLPTIPITTMIVLICSPLLLLRLIMHFSSLLFVFLCYHDHR